jgi:uncharacterized protein YdhG (YjbR/CyaY superfamily)
MAQKTAKSTVEDETTTNGFTDAEKAAMKERAKELKKSSRRSGRDKAAEDEKDVVEKLAGMPESDRVIGERIHQIIKTHAPMLAPRLWYGMPAYAKDGKVLCFFQSAEKFGARYASFGFDDIALLDEGTMWPTYFAIKEMNPENEARITELVKKAVGES